MTVSKSPLVPSANVTRAISSYSLHAYKACITILPLAVYTTVSGGRWTPHETDCIDDSIIFTLYLQFVIYHLLFIGLREKKGKKREKNPTVSTLTGLILGFFILGKKKIVPTGPL